MPSGTSRLVKFLHVVFGVPTEDGREFTAQAGEERWICEEAFCAMAHRRNFDGTPWIVDRTNFVRPDSASSSGRARAFGIIAGDDCDDHSDVESPNERRAVVGDLL